MYYIQNIGVVGNCMRFWRVNGNGYTSNLAEAWRVTKEHAESICQSRPGEDIAQDADVIDALSERHVDIQKAQARGLKVWG